MIGVDRDALRCRGDRVGDLLAVAATRWIVAGIGLAELMVPAITLTVGATQPVPWVLIVVPLGNMILCCSCNLIE